MENIVMKKLKFTAILVKKAVCTTCVRKEHANHDFVTITKLIRKLTLSRQTLLQETRNTVRRKFLANKRNISQTIHCNETLLSMKTSQLEAKREVMLQAVNEIIDYQLDSTRANNGNFQCWSQTNRKTSIWTGGRSHGKDWRICRSNNRRF